MVMTTFARVFDFEVPDGLGCLAQRVGLVDDRGDLSGLGELPQRRQVVLAWCCGEDEQPMGTKRDSI